MKINQLARLTSVIVLIIILGWAFKGAAQPSQYVTLTLASGNLPVQTNQIVSVVGYDWFQALGILGKFQDGTTIVLTPYSSGSANSAKQSSQIPQIFTGLTNISVGGNGGATFQITTPSNANVVSNYVPADAIVIPTSATGDVQIILESSTDLVNWTAASPGTYGASSATNRFFRVRAVHN